MEDDEFNFEEEFPPQEEPPSEPVRIREYSEWVRDSRCSVCGEEKEPYVEIEVDGQREYTCQECFEAEAGPPRAEVGLSCPSCGGGLGPDDRFCGKCGATAGHSCRECGTEAEAGDRFCAKCGASL